MCFHSQQHKSPQEIAKRFNFDIDNVPAEVTGTFNGFNFPKTPIITDEEPHAVSLFNWGLIPKWANDNEIRKFTLNAKIETLTEKPSFRDVVHQRCLVLSDTFFEWQWLDSKGKNKEKYSIQLAETPLFTFGGIWSRWRDPSTDKILNTYSIITKEANELMSVIHNSKKRMPLVLPVEKEQDWLNGAPLEEANSWNVELVAEKSSGQVSLF